jgi:hypothetical protein
MSKRKWLSPAAYKAVQESAKRGDKLMAAFVKREVAAHKAAQSINTKS